MLILFLPNVTATAAQRVQTVYISGVAALLLTPSDEPVGSVILLGDRIGDRRVEVGSVGVEVGADDQLVRTRNAYVDLGYAVLLPGGGIHVPSAVNYMVGIRRPVTIIAAGRNGSQRAARGIALGARPDKLVLLNGLLSPESGPDVHVMRLVGSPAYLPRTLIVHHKKNACPFSSPHGVEAFLSWSGGKAEIVWLDGDEDREPSCDPSSAHGFAGMDALVVGHVADFLARD